MSGPRRGRSTAALLTLLTLAVPAAAAADDAQKEAASALEQKAFDAIAKQDYCAAAQHFFDANRAAPTPDYIYNAAYAADLATDRKSALRLYAEVAGTHLDASREAKVNARIAALPVELGDDGPGTSCDLMLDARSAPKGVTTEGPVAAAPGDDEAASSSNAPKSESAVVGGGDDAPGASASADDANDADAHDEGGFNMLPWTVAGAAVVVMVIGIGVVVGALLTRVAHSQTNQAIKDAQAAGDGAGAAALQGQLALARFAWEGVGQFALPVGVVLGALGILGAGGGAAWGAIGLMTE